MKTRWAFTLVALQLLLRCLANDQKLVNEFVITLVGKDNAISVIESMGFEFIRKVLILISSLYRFMGLIIAI